MERRRSEEDYGAGKQTGPEELRRVCEGEVDEVDEVDGVRGGEYRGWE